MSDLPQQPINAFEKYLQKAKIAYLPKHIRILDIGCGDGSVFRDTSYQGVHGHDIDVQSLKICETIPNYTKLSNSLKDFPISTYDCVCLLGVLEHMNEEDIYDLMEQIQRARSLYITVPNADSFHRKIGVELGIVSDTLELGKQDLSIGHKRYYNRKSLLDMIYYNPNSYLNKFYVERAGTTGFKWDTSLAMEKYVSKMEAIERVAQQEGISGINNYNGAELFVYFKRR